MSEPEEIKKKMIQKLPDQLVNQIAAGEVVERPLSVVKELLDNSLDSGASRIEIDIKEGGKKLIQVRDDGSGIPPDQVHAALARHSTSKIQKIEDLNAIKTMGFRGEALASIASVSLLKLISRSDQKTSAYQVELDAGKLSSEGETAHPQGTTVSVKYLFHKTPARLKFLKSPETEMKHISDIVTKLALAHPDVSFVLRHNGKKILSSQKSNDLSQRVKDLFGKEIAQNSYPLSQESSSLKVSGLVGHPQLSRSHRRDMYFFVNGRPIQDKVIMHAVMEGYRDLLMKGRYPFLILFLHLPYEMVDVNVHPAKTEVRFSNGSILHRFVLDSVRKILHQSPWLSEEEKSLRQASTSYQAYQNSSSTFSSRENQSSLRDQLSSHNSSESYQSFKKSNSYDNNQLYSDLRQSLDSFSSFSKNDNKQNLSYDSQKKIEFGKTPYASMEVLGQFLGTYILCQSDEKLILIDQHAAHERVCFEKLLRQYEEGKVSSQSLLIPEQIEVKASDVSILEKLLDPLSKAGLELEHFGGNTFILKSSPALFKNKLKIDSLVQDLIGDSLEKNSMTSLDDKIHHLLATMACHGAIRAHHLLTKEEIYALLKECEAYQNTSFCPHGRPVSVEVTQYEIEKWFKRIL